LPTISSIVPAGSVPRTLKSAPIPLLHWTSVLTYRRGGENVGVASSAGGGVRSAAACVAAPKVRTTRATAVCSDAGVEVMLAGRPQAGRMRNAKIRESLLKRDLAMMTGIRREPADAGIRCDYSQEKEMVLGSEEPALL